MFLFPTSSISVLVKCFFIWFALNWLNNFQAEGQKLSDRTVTKARCVANCYTMYADRKNDSERVCGTTACQECLSPCEKTFKNESICIKECTNSSSCEASCWFLKYLNTLSSIRNGDGSKPPIPGTPTLRNRTFTSITLQWEPVNTTNGTSVYLIAVEFNGDSLKSPYFINTVLLVPRITISTSSLCARVGSRFPRQSFNGIHFKYHVAVLTENSSISYGTKTTDNLIPLVPVSVSNITINSIVYVANPAVGQFGKLKLTAAWKQPREHNEQVVSNYAVVWTDYCSFLRRPKTKLTGGPNTSEILYIDEKIKKCSKNLLSIYALNSCLVSAGTTLTFEYPGCENTTDFPKDKCYKWPGLPDFTICAKSAVNQGIPVHPPEAPIEDRVVRNISSAIPLTAEDDYPFNLTINWDPPAYHYKKVVLYLVTLFMYKNNSCSGEISLDYIRSGPQKKTYFIIPEVMHGEQFTYGVTPKYEFAWLEGNEQLGKTTIEVPPDNYVKVRNIEVGEFVQEEGNSTFSVKILWTGPVFSFTLYGYHFTYELTGYKKYAIRIKGNVLIHRSSNSNIIPFTLAPRAELLKVVGLKNEELVPSYSTSFRTIVRWKKPLFTQSNVSYYVYSTSKKRKGQRERRASGPYLENTTTETSVVKDGIHLNERVKFQVTPVYEASAVTGTTAKISIVRTEPKAEGALGSLGSFTPGVIAGLVIGFLLAAVICMIFIWCRWRRQKISKKKGLILGKNGFIIDHWEVDGDLVTLESEIGEGAFGKVYKGTLIKPTSSLPQKFCLKPWKKTTKTVSGSETYVVAVKVLHNMPDESVRQDFLDEIQLMKAVGSHKNIVSMVGCCTLEEPMFLLVEYAPYGDLLHYLRKHRKTSNKEHGGSVTFITPDDMTNRMKTSGETKSLKMEDQEEKEDHNEEILTYGNLMAFAWHICQGMDYLARKGYVHRDLAARNVLIGENKIAKVSDFGLSRHVYEEKVYHGKPNRKLPLKWMSTEAIFDHTFTTKSDVWAFGVVLWEIVTLGGTPYPTIESKELFRLLKNGYRMEKPDTCNKELYKMMHDCWQDNPENRPTFTQIRETLETIMQKDNPYVDLTAVKESHVEYNVQCFDSMAEESDDDQRDDNVEVVCHEEAGGNVKVNITKNDPQPSNLSVDSNIKSETQLRTGSNNCAKNHQDPEIYVGLFNTLETRF
ncbi:uncharacterized protein [Porites lutea]|uniref:uncharacterized protein n=1 Tax=Porites lutea TaxID=51062 RepID=UPI003CC6CA8C